MPFTFDCYVIYRGSRDEVSGGTAINPRLKGLITYHSVDAHTDAKMQEIIRSEFASHTIIMIAHRLSSLLDFDYVAVLDAGCVAEFGKVNDLVDDVESAFYKLWQDSKRRHERLGDHCLTREEAVHSADGSIR